MSSRTAAVVFVLLSAGPVAAQQVSDVATQLDSAGRQGIVRQAQAVPIRIQVGYRLQWPLIAVGALDEQADALTQAHQVLYDLTARECDHLRVLTAGACRLTTMTVDDRNQPIGLVNPNLATVSATATFEITPEPSSAPPPKP